MGKFEEVYRSIISESTEDVIKKVKDFLDGKNIEWSYKKSGLINITLGPNGNETTFKDGKKVSGDLPKNVNVQKIVNKLLELGVKDLNIFY